MILSNHITEYVNAQVLMNEVTLGRGMVNEVVFLTRGVKNLPIVLVYVKTIQCI